WQKANLHFRKAKLSLGYGEGEIAERG
nr:hypothetical protein [Tanacetum cinerariifolium]